MLVVPQGGNIALLELLRASWAAAKPVLVLYRNDVSPSLTSTLADFEPSTFPGAIPHNLDFGAAAIDATDHAYLEASILTYVSLADPVEPERVFGCYVTDSTGLILLWAERFPRRLWIRKAGQEFSILPKFGALSEFTG